MAASARAGTRRRSRKRSRPLDWSSMDVESFMAEGMEGLSEGEGQEEGEGQPTAAKRKRERKDRHRDQLSRLEDTDAEFHDFLKENDPNLLTFDLSEDEAASSSDSDGVSSDNDGDSDGDGTSDHAGEDSDVDVIETAPAGVTSYPERPKVRGGEEEEEGSSVASSDEEVAEDTSAAERGEGTLVTMAMAKMWIQRVTKKQSLHSMKRIALALHGGVVHMVGGASSEGEVPAYHVDDSQVFNVLLVAALKNMAAFLDRHLVQGKRASKRPQLRSMVRQYLSDLVVLVKGLSEPSMLGALLRHVQALLRHFAVLPKILRELTRQLVVCWSQGEEHVRVLAFLTLRRIVLLRPHPTLGKVVKRLYMAFVRNSKLTTPQTLPAVHFMQSSLVELCRIDPPTTYYYAFVYIRQLAVHLRSAISSKSKESAQPVANWQFLHCLSLWSHVLAEVGDTSLRPLVFPLVQVTIGVMQLLPSQQHCPLRLHCVECLHLMARELGVFVPTAPHLLDILRWRGMKSSKGTGQQLMGKPLDLSCLLKLSASQLNSKSVQTSILDHTYELLAEYFVINSHSIAFPELVLPTVMELNKVTKETQFSWFKRQLKQLVDKVNEVAADTNRRRSTVTFAPKDAQQITVWENEGRLSENTLETFLLSWRRARQKQQDSEEQVAPSKPTSSQRRGRGGEAGQRGGKAVADEDIVTDMFPL